MGSLCVHFSSFLLPLEFGLHRIRYVLGFAVCRLHVTAGAIVLQTLAVGEVVELLKELVPEALFDEVVGELFK